MSTRGEASGSSPEEKGSRTESRKAESRPRKSDPPSPVSEGQAERSKILAALEAGLIEAWSGLEVLDRELVFDDDRRADLAAVEATGRAVLVLIAGEDSAETVLAALDLLDFARSNVEIVARHLGEPADAFLEPRVAVVDPRNDPRLLERLGRLSKSGIEVIGVRTVRSASGERSYLVASRLLLEEPASAEILLAGLPLPLSDLARPLFDRMARVDPECRALADRGAVVWRARGAVLARLERRDDRLEASFESGVRFSLAGAEDVERVVETALERVARGIEPGRGATAPRQLSGIPESEPLLTPEEIQAFRD